LPAASRSCKISPTTARTPLGWPHQRTRRPRVCPIWAAIIECTRPSLQRPCRRASPPCKCLAISDPPAADGPTVTVVRGLISLPVSSGRRARILPPRSQGLPCVSFLSHDPAALSSSRRRGSDPAHTKRTWSGTVGTRTVVARAKPCKRSSFLVVLPCAIRHGHH
jgi:hypothetical protein